MRRWWWDVTSAIGMLAMVGCAEGPRGARNPGIVGGPQDGFDDGSSEGEDDDGSHDEGEDEDDSTGGEPDATGENPLASDVSVDLIEANQAVAVTIAQDSEVVAPASRNAELVAGRTTLVSAGWLLEDAFAPREIEARLLLSFADGRTDTLSDTKMVAGAANLSRSDGAFSWTLAPEQVEPQMRASVTLHEVDGVARSGTTAGARFPRDGADVDLAVRAEEMAMTIVLIPVSTPEGSFMPGPSEIIAIEDRLLATFPLQHVEIRVRQPWVRTTRLTSVDEAFDFMTSARAQDGESTAPYYHLVLEDATCCSGADFEGWAGVANMVSDSGDSLREGITKFYPADRDFEWDLSTLVHELGHNHGRDHAPCGALDVWDPAYPYADAVLGARGWDREHGTLIDPVAIVPDSGRPYTDIMSYCWPRWWSDYSWQALVERVRLVSSLAAAPIAEPRWRLRGFARPSGEVTWSWIRVPATADIDAGPGTLTLHADDGSTTDVPVRVSSLGDTDIRMLEADAPISLALSELEVHLPDGLRSRTPASAIRIAP